jgi:hypothetical protein
MGFAQTRQNGMKRWLAGPVGKAYAYSLGLSDDAALIDSKQATTWKWPMPGVASTDQYDLEMIGNHRGILRGPSETGEHFLTRLYRAHEMWYWSGTTAGAVQPFEAYEGLGVTGAKLVYSHPSYDGTEQGDLFYRHEPPSAITVVAYDYQDGGGPWWPNGDTAKPFYSKVHWVVDSSGVDAPWQSDGTFGDPGAFDEDGLIGSTATSTDLLYLRRTILRQKAEYAFPILIAVVLSGDSMIGYLPPGVETFADDSGVFGDQGEVVFWRINHFDGEDGLWGGVDGTFADTGDFMPILEEEFI